MFSFNLTLSLASGTYLLPRFLVSYIPAVRLTVVQRDCDVLIAVAFRACDHSASTILIRSPIHRITGTAIELPIALYRGPSGQLSASLLRQGICV